jgi:hypothetical protein
MKGLKLSNSIYAKKGIMGSGLDVEGGRLINNRPDGMTGIAQMAANKKIMKRIDKVDMIAEGTSLGYMRAEMMEGPEGM